MYTKDCPECEGKMNLEVEDGDMIYFCEECDNYMYMNDDEENKMWDDTINAEIEEGHGMAG